VRVIAGKLGGRPLRAPKGTATRPTTDRVREALFSMLGELAGAKVLDLYAGTGALGIEAMSRGAERCVFVESRRPALAALRSNLTSLALDDTCVVLPVPVERAHVPVAKEAPFDLVLCDPPWSDLPHALRALADLVPHLGLQSGFRLVLEHSAADDPVLDEKAGLALATRRVWGDTAVSVFTFMEDARNVP
jgi:16S rRNA (guanine966-N2)-methyltransferase